jgi:hypothetical protein
VREFYTFDFYSLYLGFFAGIEFFPHLCRGRFVEVIQVIV